MTRRALPAVGRTERERFDRLTLEERLSDLGWVSVKSSWIDAVRYDPVNRTLSVRTREGRQYDGYPNCTPQMFEQLLDAASAGKWYWQYYPPRGRGRKRQGHTPGPRPRAGRVRA